MMSNRGYLIYLNIIDYMIEHKHPPSVRDLVERMGFKTTSAVTYHLRRMEKAGILEPAGGRARAFIPTGTTVACPTMGKVDYDRMMRDAHEA